MTEEEWEVIGYFSRYRILASGEKRRLEDPDTGKIIREYMVPVVRDPAESADTKEIIQPSSEYTIHMKDDS